MTTHPAPSDFESRTNATYDALMWALSRPGLPRDLPAAGRQGIVEALLDRECNVHCAEPELAGFVARTGAALVAPEHADHLFFDALPSADVLQRISLGSDLYPETGATLVCNGTIGARRALRLTGPGCNGPVEVQVDGLPEGFWQMRTRVMRYPLGFELFIVDGARVLGLPRTTQVEVI